MSTSAVCVVNHNTRDLLRTCVRSVLAEDPDHVIVVDNASTDGSAEMVEREFQTVSLMRLEENIGYGAAANRAIRSTEADDVMVLNADTVLKPGLLDVMRAHLAVTDQHVILGPRILNPDGTLQTSCFRFPSPFHMFLYLSGLARWLPRTPWLGRRSLQQVRGESPRPVPWVLGAGLAFRRSTFEHLGGFDESFFMYFEEVDLCRRVWNEGGAVHYVPAAEMVHVGGASTRANRVEMGVQYFESLERFYRKHYSGFSLTRLRLTLKALALVHAVHHRLMRKRKGATASTLSSDLAVHQSLLSGRRPRSDIPPATPGRAGLASQPGHESGGEDLQGMGRE